MKALDIALKDLVRSFRSMFAVIFMFGVPLLVTGMFYFMFGNIVQGGEFNLPRTQVIVANLDDGGPRFQVSTKSIPGSEDADTMGDLVVAVLQSDEIADLIAISFAQDAKAAHAAVDAQEAQVAIVIPPDFSKQFADLDGEAVIEFYQDPTLTIGPKIIRAILNRFMDGMAGVKIAVNVFLDEAKSEEYALVGQVVQGYLDTSLAQSEDPAADLLEVRSAARGPEEAAEESANLLVSIITPIMSAMMIFYAFFTGTSSAQSILKEEEERTLPRLFTTPTTQATILSGKILSVFLTVLVQMSVLIVAARLIFGIYWGEALPLGISILGSIVLASSFGIFINSMTRDTKQSGAIFGGVLTLTGMIGMIPIFAANSPGAARVSDTVSLLVPQGWAIRGLLQVMDGAPVSGVLVTTLIMLVWSAIFFIVGVWRFKQRYA